MALNCAAYSDILGWWSAFIGAFGAILLVRPLFILLQFREALESLVYALDKNLTPEDLRDQLMEARQKLAAEIFSKRKTWKRWAWAGLTFLCVAILILLAQSPCVF
jgi:hypothetical protein